MTNTFRIQMMTADNYNKYMMGDNGYFITAIEVEAESAEQAVATAKAEHPNMVINEKNVQTVEEMKAEIEARKIYWENFYKAEEERKANNRAKRLAKEQEKANALGLTVEEYKAKVKREKAIKEAEKAVAEAEQALARAKATLAKLQNEN